MKRTALALTAACMVLAGCGGGTDEVAAATPTPTLAPYTPSDELTASKESAAASKKAAASSAAAATPATTELSLEAEQGLVTGITADAFEKNRDGLSDELVKSSSLVEAQTDFRFDRGARTLVLAVTSTYRTDTYVPELAYDLATGFAPVFWGPETSGTVQPEALPLFSVTVDDASFVCEPTDMVALQKRELSSEMFVERCGQ
jgi:hypothetical protein